MFDTGNSIHEEVFAVRSTEAANLCSSTGVGLTKTAGEAAVDTFIREGWLEKSRAGFYTLSERGLLELRSYLTDMFNDLEEEGEGTRIDKIRTCHACQEIITKVTI
jgi:non-structural maintenance of chromosomes element 1